MPITLAACLCAACQARVQRLLSDVKGAKNVAIDLAKGQVKIEMVRHIAISCKIFLKNHPLPFNTPVLAL